MYSCSPNPTCVCRHSAPQPEGPRLHGVWGESPAYRRYPCSLREAVGDGEQPELRDAMDGTARIDCHLHYLAPWSREELRVSLAGKNLFQQVVADRPAWVDLSVHRELMASSGIEMAVIVPYGSEQLLGLRRLGGSINEACEAYNHSMSEDL